MDFDLLRRRLGRAVRDVPEGDWPVDAMTVLADAGCLGFTIARQYGGSQVTPEDQLRTYEVVASESLTCALILTQHDGACELIGDCDNRVLAARLLPEFAAGRALTTVGISQLTTSRRDSGPAMHATLDRDGYVLDGVMPWVTSVGHAGHIVTGAVLEDGMQVLLCVPADLDGLRVGEPMQLMALTGSSTAEVRCEACRVSRDLLLRGPHERVLALRAPAKPLSVSAVGIGVARSLLEHIDRRAPSLPDFGSDLHSSVRAAFDAVHGRLYDAANELHDPKAEVPSMEIRVAVNDLVVRLAVTYMTLAKGSGYLSNRPAERLLREATFFLVWSAPPAVQMGTLKSIWNVEFDASSLGRGANAASEA